MTPIEEQIVVWDEKLKEPLKIINECRGERESLEKNLEIKDLDKLLLEIKRIQEKLGFSSLTVTEEKKLIERKQKLESQINNVK